jgi:hypothetical protein
MRQATASKGRDKWQSNKKTVDGLRRRYPNMHPLLFQRTVERANSAGEAFDILEGVSATFPVVWDDQGRRWANLTDMWLEPESKGK